MSSFRFTGLHVNKRFKLDTKNWAKAIINMKMHENKQFLSKPWSQY